MLTHKHTTKDGQTTLIGEMNTDHILRYIFLVLEKLASSVADMNKKQSAYQSKLYGFRTLGEEELASIVNASLHMLSPYFFEMMFRWDEIYDSPKLNKLYSDVHLCLTQICGRAGKLELNTRPLLNSTNNDEVFDFEDDTDLEF